MKLSSIFSRAFGWLTWRRHVARGIICDPGHEGSPPVFLIAKGRIPPRIWHLPGGGIGRVRTDEGHKKETPENALRRELFEELCLGPEQIESIAWVGQRASMVALVPHLEELFLVRVKPGLCKQPIRKAWELVDARWVKFDDLAEVLGHDIAVLAKVKMLI